MPPVCNPQLLIFFVRLWPCR